MRECVPCVTIGNVSRETNSVVLLSLSECGAAPCSSQSVVTLVINAKNLCATKLFGLTGVEARVL